MIPPHPDRKSHRCGTVENAKDMRTGSNGTEIERFRQPFGKFVGQGQGRETGSKTNFKFRRGKRHYSGKLKQGQGMHLGQTSCETETLFSACLRKSSVSPRSPSDSWRLACPYKGHRAIKLSQTERHSTVSNNLMFGKSTAWHASYVTDNFAVSG